MSSRCVICERPFVNKNALKQHLRDSPAHERHHRKPRTHQDTETPLDAFFRSFPTFDYDPTFPPATSYANLRQHKRWRRGDIESDDAWNRYQEALERELHMWYGTENDLTAWHALCRAIGVKPLPKTCEKCEVVRDQVKNLADSY
jgi:hypothetical protein